MDETQNSFAAIVENVKQNFERLTMPQRLGLVVLLAFGLAAIPVLFLVGQEPELAVLFSNMEEADVQAIMTRLDGQQIPYSQAPGNNTLMVPADRVHELRLQFAADGLPEAGGVGFEIFDRTNLGIGEFAQKVNFRRALQGELSRTISQMPGVLRARVHLVTPERHLFTSEAEPARAAVVITPKRGGKLSPEQVQGIVHLVASSVENLVPKQVTVVNSRGQVLTRPEQEGQMELSGSQIEIQRNLERDLEHRVQTMLDQVLGSEKSVVRVSALMDFRQIETTEEAFDPETQVVRSEQRSQEKVMGDDGVAGVPGARSNVPEEDSVAGGPGKKEAKRKSETVNYEVNRKVSKVVEASGTIKRLSVAVLVDGTYVTEVNAETGETTSQYAARPEEQMNNLVESIKKAVGFSAERGDQIEVVNHQFDNSTPDSLEPSTFGMVQEFILAWGGHLKPLVLLLLGVAVLFIVVKPLVKNIVEPPLPQTAITAQGLPATVGELEAQEEVMTPEQQALQLAIQNPQAAAFVIREWMKEETEAEEGVKK